MLEPFIPIVENKTIFHLRIKAGGAHSDQILSCISIGSLGKRWNSVRGEGSVALALVDEEVKDVASYKPIFALIELLLPLTPTRYSSPLGQRLWQ